MKSRRSFLKLSSIPFIAAIIPVAKSINGEPTEKKSPIQKLADAENQFRKTGSCRADFSGDELKLSDATTASEVEYFRILAEQRKKALERLASHMEEKVLGYSTAGYNAIDQAKFTARNCMSQGSSADMFNRAYYVYLDRNVTLGDKVQAGEYSIRNERSVGIHSNE